MKINYVIGVLILNNEYVKVRSIDMENKVVDVDIQTVKGISEKTIKNLRAFELVPHEGSYAIEEEIKDGHVAYDGSNDEELVESVRAYLQEEQNQLEENERKTVYQIIVNIWVNAEFVKMAGYIIGENKEHAENIAKAYCMDRYGCALHDAYILDVEPTDLSVRETIVSLSKTGYDKLKKTTYAMKVEAPMFEIGVKDFVPTPFEAEIEAATQNEAECVIKDVYACEFNTDPSEIRIVDIATK